MPTLRACLKTHTWQTLKAITSVHQLPFSSNWTKEQIRRQLLDYLARPAIVIRLAGQLPPGEKEVLATLLAGGGSLPYPEFCRLFGPLEPYRPWRPGATRRPWLHPTSPAQHLYFLGYVYRQPGGTNEADCMPSPEDGKVVLPDEFKAWLGLLKPPDPILEVVIPSLDKPDQWPTPDLSVTYLLALCQRESIRPLHNRWLAPRWLAQWLTCLPLELDLAGVRSERQVPYLAFMHYLAEAAGLLSLQASFLKPSTTAWRWLDLPAGDQRRVLWDGWLHDLVQDRSLWLAYRFPPWLEITPGTLRRWLEDGLIPERD